MDWNLEYISKAFLNLLQRDELCCLKIVVERQSFDELFQTAADVSFVTVVALWQGELLRRGCLFQHADNVVEFSFGER
jgi:hypothetical protein